MLTGRLARCNGICFGHARHKDPGKLCHPFHHLSDRHGNGNTLRWINDTGAAVAAHQVAIIHL